jgi:hypothetical protein
MSTEPNCVRYSAPVGQTSRQPACSQCLQESLIISQRAPVRSALSLFGPICSMNFTWRQSYEFRCPVLS